LIKKQALFHKTSLLVVMRLLYYKKLYCIHFIYFL